MTREMVRPGKGRRRRGSSKTELLFGRRKEGKEVIHCRSFKQNNPRRASQSVEPRAGREKEEALKGR